MPEPDVRVIVRNEQHARVLVLSNPTRKNAIGPAMIAQLLTLLDAANADPSVRSIVITGEGSAFCAGGDFGQVFKADAASGAARGDYAALLQTLCENPKPTIAKVNGLAMGGGLGIVACCTFAVGCESAMLGTPEINVGLFPMMIMAVLARIVPQRELLKMMLLGEKMSAKEGVRIGLLSECVPEEALDETVMKLVQKLGAKSPAAMQHGLSAFAAQGDLRLSEALPLLQQRLFAVLSTDDAREGLSAFLEKRTPNWTGR
jgi:enoyl-CoA hydratase/carnithine racemase